MSALKSYSTRRQGSVSGSLLQSLPGIGKVWDGSRGKEEENMIFIDHHQKRDPFRRNIVPIKSLLSWDHSGCKKGSRTGVRFIWGSIWVEESEIVRFVAVGALRRCEHCKIY